MTDLDDRAVMAWFRSLPPTVRLDVDVSRRARGYTAIAPRRKVPDGRNVRCSICGRRDPVWYTNESGSKAQRAAEVAAARHLRTHLPVSDDLTS